MSLIDRQNEMKSLEIQAAARLLYNRADNIDMIQWIIVIALPVLKFFFLQNIFLNYVMIIWFFASFVLDYYIERYTDAAAELKKDFDYYVYGWNTKLLEKSIHISKTYKARNKEFFKKQTQNSGVNEPGGVKDWYTTVAKDMHKEEAIRAAMKENIYFDERINKFAYWFIGIFIAILILALAISEMTLYEVLFGLFVTFASFAKKIYSTFLNLKRVSMINSNIENLLHSKDTNLVYLQSEIDKKRSISRTSNKIIYFFQRKRVHEEVSVFKSDE